MADFRKRESEHAKREKELVRKSSKGAYYQEELSKAQAQISLLEGKLQQRMQEMSDMEEQLADLRHNAALYSNGGGTDRDKSPTNPRRRLSARSTAVATKGNEVVESFESVVEDLYERCV